MSRVQEIHGGFRQLVENLGRLFELEQERDNILGVMQSATRQLLIFGQPGAISIESTDTPEWVGDVAFPALTELQAERDLLDSKMPT